MFESLKFAIAHAWGYKDGSLWDRVRLYQHMRWNERQLKYAEKLHPLEQHVLRDKAMMHKMKRLR